MEGVLDLISFKIGTVGDKLMPILFFFYAFWVVLRIKWSSLCLKLDLHLYGEDLPFEAQLLKLSDEVVLLY